MDAARESSVRHFGALERARAVVLGALFVQIPFELQSSFLGLSNLQWTFVILGIVSVPLLVRYWRDLKRDRLAQAAGLFVAVQWIAASYAPEFNGNAYKAAIRFTAGLLLMLIVRYTSDRRFVFRVWAFTVIVAALYALLDQAGYGLNLFRNREFFIAQVQRLSGSFEYPNVAAAYFVISLPLLWRTPLHPAVKWSGVLLLWLALLLTFSRGAVVAVLAVIAGEAFLTKRRGEWKTAVSVIVTGVVAAIVLAAFDADLVSTFTRSVPSPSLSAQYKSEWNRFHQRPDVGDEISINIRNTGPIPWPANGRGRVAISYRWRDLGTRKTLPGTLVTNLQRDVQPGESIDVSVRFQTPQTPGKYLMAVEPFVREFDWFSNAGAPPFYVEADIEPEAVRSVEQADLSGWYRLRSQGVPAGPKGVDRPVLWSAALKMFSAHPWGVGPDNYRLQVGRILGATDWNTDIHSNSMYLELLTGSGVLGLGAFLLFAITIRWRLEAACLALAVFLVHGLVDSFLMSTPIYFGFWMLAGLTRRKDAVAGWY